MGLGGGKRREWRGGEVSSEGWLGGKELGWLDSPQPKKSVRLDVEEVESVVGVSNDFGEGPGEDEEGVGGGDFGLSTRAFEERKREAGQLQVRRGTQRGFREMKTRLSSERRELELSVGGGAR